MTVDIWGREPCRGCLPGYGEALCTERDTIAGSVHRAVFHPRALLDGDVWRCFDCGATSGRMTSRAGSGEAPPVGFTVG